MSTGFIVSTTARTLLAIAAAAAIGSSPALAAAAAADDARQSSTQQVPSGGRDGAPLPARQDTYRELQTTGPRSGDTGTASSKAAAGSTQSAPAGNDFWFYTADVVLFNDDDGDGYFHGIDLLFDADTYFDAVDVYAVLFLSLEGGPWNEYAATDTFTLFGATSDDEFVVVTELTSGYPAGDYDLLIELYDAVDGAFLASYGPSDTSELAFLPLEDFDRDAPLDDEIVVVGHRHGGGGSSGVVTVAVLAALWLVCRVRRPRIPRREHRARCA